MATIQLGNTKIASKLINYCEKKAVEREGINCSPEYAKSQFKTTRELWGKASGVQAHHVIQSFKPGEVTPQLANQIGKDLVKKIGKGHEAVIYTHADKEHIHNHIVINAVNHENGKKYQSKKSDLYKIREVSDQLCKEKGLSIVKEPSAKNRYHRAEYGLAKRGIMSWKDEIREVINHEKQHSKTYEDFKRNLSEKYGIEVKERGKHISFKHPDYQKFVRGKTLGLDYERGTIENGFSRQIERGTGSRKSITDILFGRDRKANSVSSSRTGNIKQQDKSEHGKVTGERQTEDHIKKQSQRSLQGYVSGIKGLEISTTGRNTKDISSYARGNLQDRGQSQRNDKTDKGHGIHSKTDTQSQLEGKGETVRNPIANNNRLDSRIGRNLSTGGAFDEILKSLSSAIQKADNIEKAKAEQQQKALEKQKQLEKATPARGRDYDMER